jgi:hypothetical protein
MEIPDDTQIGNKTISPELEQLFSDLASHVTHTYEIVTRIKSKAHEEGFNDDEIHNLLRHNLSKFLDRNQVNYILTVKDQRKQKREAKMLTNQQNDSKNVPSIPAPEYNIIPLDRNKVDEELTNEVQVEKDHQMEDLRMQLINAENKYNDLVAKVITLEEKYKGIEGKITSLSSDNSPTPQVNNLEPKEKNQKTKVVVSDLFREVLRLKGSHIIYANIEIDKLQNKYIRLEPL